MNIFNRKKKEEDKTKEEKAFDQVSLDLNDLEKKAEALDSEELRMNFFHIIRKFYSSFLRVNYSSTLEEINKEIKQNKKIKGKIQVDLINFNNKITHIEYSPEPKEKTEILELINEFLDIITKSKNQLIISKHVKRKKRKTKFTKFKQGFKKKVNKHKIQKMIIDSYANLENDNFDKAAKIYNKIKKDYEFLTEKEQKEIKPDVLELYLEIKKAEKKNSS